MAHTLTAEEKRIDKVFSSDYVFTIPGYQRPYSWGTDHAQTLLDDLQMALEEAPIEVADAADYFLGSVVLIKPDQRPAVEVVDGQQRLTTLTILLSAIRHVSRNPDIQRELTAYIYEKGQVGKGTPDRFRLTLRKRDADFFRRYIQKEDGLKDLLQLGSRLTEVEQRIRDNAKIFVAALDRLDPTQLLRLYQFIVQCCTLVVVSTPDENSAHRIFGVMNSRGMNLNATDVLKARIVGKLPESLQDSYTAKWEDAEESLGRDRFNELFSHIRTVYLKAKSQATLLKDFEVNVPVLRDAVQQAPQQLLDEVILPMAEDFAQVSRATFSSTRHSDAINNHLKWLNSLEFQDWVPPVLAFLARHRNDPEQVKAFLADLERLAYSMTLRRDDVNRRIRRFARLTRAIEGDQHDVWADERLADGNTNAKYHNASLDKLKALFDAGDVAGLEAFQVGSNSYAVRLQQLARQAAEALKQGHALQGEPALQLTEKEKQDTVAVLGGDLYGVLPTRVLAVVLKRLDQLLSNQNVMHSGDASIEHVLPQTPATRSDRLSWIPDVEVRNHWVHKLGNLVLLSRYKNCEAQNFDFGKKKAKYFSSQTGVVNFALTTQVLTHAIWDTNTLQQRQEELLAHFIKHWRLA